MNTGNDEFTAIRVETVVLSTVADILVEPALFGLKIDFATPLTRAVLVGLKLPWVVLKVAINPLKMFAVVGP